MPQNKSKVLPAMITLAVVVGGIAYLFYSSAGEAFEYYKHVDEVMSEPAKWEGKHLQLHGFVVPDSIKRRMDTAHQQIEYKFRATNCGPDVEVRYAGTVPDTFKDRAEVVVKGQLAAGYFQASEISAKCPSKYNTAADSPTVTMCTKDRSNPAAQAKVN
jgi:cytochrome c-type biogenesis protein CcmE